jgi:nucleoside triphosphate diphosphatase
VTPSQPKTGAPADPPPTPADSAAPADPSAPADLPAPDSRAPADPSAPADSAAPADLPGPDSLAPADSAAPADSPAEPAQPSDGATPAAPLLDRSLDVVRFLRANCEWDAAQTPHTLLPFLLEEAHEVADAVAAGADRELPGELGDLLLNVAFQVVLAEERGAFTADDVVTALETKMRRRHPHLYGGGPRQDWESLKARERTAANADHSLLHGLAGGLEPLSKAQRIQERVATVGFDWADAQGAFDKVAEELEEVREALAAEPSPALEEELGDLLFAVVNLVRLSGGHAMRALQRANTKFTGRFEALERLARKRGVVLGEASLEDLDSLWDEIKSQERSQPDADPATHNP